MRGSQGGGYDTAQRIVGQVERSELAEVAELRWNSACQLIRSEDEIGEALKVAQLSRDWPGELVRPEAQLLSVWLFPSSGGIDPVKRFAKRLRTLREGRLLSHAGILPDSWL